MIPGMSEREHMVIVWGQPQSVMVHQKSKHVWQAVGEYAGGTIRVQDRSAGAAINHWREAATFKGERLMVTRPALSGARRDFYLPINLQKGRFGAPEPNSRLKFAPQ